MAPGKKNYYIEPVEIEIYLKKIGKVRTIIKEMYVELFDVEGASCLYRGEHEDAR